MPARERIRRTDADKSVMKEKTEKADLEESENRALRETKNYITKMTEKIEK